MSNLESEVGTDPDSDDVGVSGDVWRVFGWRVWPVPKSLACDGTIQSVSLDRMLIIISN